MGPANNSLVPTATRSATAEGGAKDGQRPLGLAASSSGGRAARGPEPLVGAGVSAAPTGTLGPARKGGGRSHVSPKAQEAG